MSWNGRILFASSVLLVMSCSAPTNPADAGPGPDVDVDIDDTDSDLQMVDLLLLLDTSCEASAIQAELARSAEAFFRELFFPTFDPRAGETPLPVLDVHIGVTTMAADMYGVEIVGCEAPEMGALVVDEDRPCMGTVELADDCPTPPCRWLRRRGALSAVADEMGLEALLADLSCLTSFGGCGCGWEQPLEALRWGVIEQVEPGGPNEGFFREDSLLVVVVVGSEDDCSISDATLLPPSEWPGYPTTICHLNPDALYSVERYTSILRDVLHGREERIVFAVLGGFPDDMSWSPGDPVDELYSLIRVDPEDEQVLSPACSSPGGWAFPAPRLVDVAYTFGDAAFVGSICAEDWSAMMHDFARTVQRRLSAAR